MTETVKKYKMDFFDLSKDPRFANLPETEEDYSRVVNALRRGDMSCVEERMGPVNRMAVRGQKA